MAIERRPKHVRFHSPVFVSRKISITPLSTPSSPMRSPILCGPSGESATFRHLVKGEGDGRAARRSLSLDSFLFYATTPVGAQLTGTTSNNGNNTQRATPSSLAARFLHAVLAPSTNLPHWQDGRRAQPLKQHSSSQLPATTTPIANPPASVPSSQQPSPAPSPLPKLPSVASFIDSEEGAEQEEGKTATKPSSTTPSSSTTTNKKNFDQHQTPPWPVLSTRNRPIPLEWRQQALPFFPILTWRRGTTKPGRWIKGGVAKKLPTSHSFPMASSSTSDNNKMMMQEEFNTAAGKESPSDEKVEIRRMSLKEFSGLDSQDNAHSVIVDPTKQPQAQPDHTASPLLVRLHNASANVGSLLDKFSSNRRRSSAGLNKLSHWNNTHAAGGGEVRNAFSGENLYDSFDAAIEGINLAINEASLNQEAIKKKKDASQRSGSMDSGVEEGQQQQQKPVLVGSMVFEQAYHRLSAVKDRLNTTMKNIPNESPRKKHEGVEAERMDMLNESRLLVSACKSMVRSNTSPNNDPDFFPLVQNTVTCADRVTQTVEATLRKRSSLFQAQLMVAKTEQMLNALTETIHDLEKAYGAPKYGPEAKQLIRSSTTLAAALTQLIQAIQHL